MYKEFLGKESTPVINRVDFSSVRKFAEATNNNHSLYYDEEYGKNSIYSGNIVPPTYPQILEYGELENFHLPVDGLIHGEQHFQYYRPLKVGEEINCFFEISDSYSKETKSGTLTFLIRNRFGQEIVSKQLIYKITEITVITEAVRRKLQNAQP